MSAQSAGQSPRLRRKSPRGVSLILVMLSMLLLTVLAATIVFTARSETFASYNYKLDTQADYLAKAGIQMAIAWFRSDRYVPVSENLGGTYYNVTSSGPPYNLYTSNTAPIWCTAASGCPSPCTGGPPCTAGRAVQLMTIPGTGSSNYPTLTNSGGLTVKDAFAQDLGGGASATLTADARNSGVVYVNAVLRVYATVNDGRLPNVTPKVLETWYLTSRAVLNGSQAMAEETAVIQPIYVPYFANAMYGYCSVGMGGTSGTCTDAYNSAAGPYDPAIAAGPCGSPTAPNVIDAGAGVGSNGYVNLASGVVVGGDVTLGSNPTPGCPLPAACPPTCYSGGGTVLGQVINGPPQVPPTTPPIPGTGQPGPPAYTFPANTLGYDNASTPVTLPQTSTGGTPPLGTYLVPGPPPSPPHWYANGTPAGYWDGNGVSHPGPPPPGPPFGPPPLWPPTPPTYGAPSPPTPPNYGPGDMPTALDTPPAPAPPATPNYRFSYPPIITPAPVPAPSPAPGPQYSVPCETTGLLGVVCDGSQARPYLIRKIDISGAATNIVTLVGGPDIFHPVYYDIDVISESGQAAIQVRGYVVFNVKTTLDITGQGTSNTTMNNAPETMVINYIGTNDVHLGGNGSISAVVIAPNATVALKGGGVGGYMLGSIQANNVLMQGGYPLHYDIQLSNAGGALGRIITISYNRKKM